MKSYAIFVTLAIVRQTLPSTHFTADSRRNNFNGTTAFYGLIFLLQYVLKTKILNLRMT
jgi:hypothetical protein